MVLLCILSTFTCFYIYDNNEDLAGHSIDKIITFQADTIKSCANDKANILGMGNCLHTE